MRPSPSTPKKSTPTPAPTGPSDASDRGSTRPVSTRDLDATPACVLSAGRTVTRTKKEGTPSGFDIDQARKSFARRMDAGTRGDAGGKMDDFPGSSGDTDGDTGHGLGDDHHDHHDHGDDIDIDIDIDIDYWSHPTYCPGGWWYAWGDYDHDGFIDYVCTNGSYSVYWYNWGGSYWDCSPWFGWYGWYGWSSGRYYWWRNTIPDSYRGVVYGIDAELLDEPTPDPVGDVPETQPEAVPLSAVEVARLEMSLGNPQIAIEAYRAHLSTYPDDWYALRELGLALIRDNQRNDGIALVGYAHSQSPTLAFAPIPVELFGGDAQVMRDALVSVVGWAHRNPSASAWLTVAVLMQGEGRNAPALKIIERAEGLGLGYDIAGQMRSALSVP